MSPFSRRALLKAAGAAPLAAAIPVQAGPAAAAVTGLDAPLPYDYPTVYPLPFAHGVASGDPLAERVILWTRLTLPDPGAVASVEVTYEVARDPAMTLVVATGTVTTHAARDWTVKVDPLLPDPATTYYYRFTALGRRSVIGRTRTAPAGDVAELRLAVVACSSYWSAYFNAYRRLAERNDLDLVVHCGDHVYDFVDEDEWVRARGGRFDLADVDFRDWRSIDEVRRRYALYYADPDFAELHRQHPIAILWDNHDIEPEPGVTLKQVLQVFWEWTPTRAPRPDGSGAFPQRATGQVPVEGSPYVYRQLAYGQMADLLFMDTRLIGKQPESVPVAQRRLLGDAQYGWLSGELDRSAARWRFVVNGWPLGQLKIANTPGGAALPVPGQVRDGVQFYGAWDAYPFERNRLLGFLRANRVTDNLVVTGDAHGNFAWDLVEDPTLPAYEPATGGGTLGSVGVEFAPSSVGRGGADETIAGELYRARFGRPPFADRAGYEALLPAAQAAAIGLEQALSEQNLALRYIQWRDHGYGIVHLTAQEALLEYWWQPILQPSGEDRLGAQLRVVRGTDHVVPVALPAATSGSRVSAPAPQDQAPPAVVPEASAVLLGVAAAAVAAGAVAVAHRRAGTPAED